MRQAARMAEGRRRAEIIRPIASVTPRSLRRRRPRGRASNSIVHEERTAAPPNHRGLLFYRLLEQAVQTEPTPLASMLGGAS